MLENIGGSLPGGINWECSWHLHKKKSSMNILKSLWLLPVCLLRAVGSAVLILFFHLTLSTFHVALLEGFPWLLFSVAEMLGLTVSHCRSSLWLVPWPTTGRHAVLQPSALQWKLSWVASCCFCVAWSRQPNVCQGSSLMAVCILLAYCFPSLETKRVRRVSSSYRWKN